MLRTGTKIVCLVGFVCLTGCGSDNDSPAASSAVPVTMIDRSHLANVGTTAALDYSDPNLWMCRPGNQPNECEVDLDATEFLADGSRKVVPHVRATNPKFDCFYVYPTIDLNGDGNLTHFSDVSAERDPLYAQAARFTRVCEVYAPLYRQVSLSAGTNVTGSSALALQDVRDAFRFYLEHLSKGRNFVIMGHSQGASMLAAMMETDVDDVPKVRSRMISALLIGGGVAVAQGQRTAGTITATGMGGIPQGLGFKNIPTCATPGETGCVIAYSSFDTRYPPGSHSLFGRAPDGLETACVNPAAIAGNSGPYRGSYFPVHLNQPFFSGLEPIPKGVTTPFLLYRNVFDGECVHRNGFSYLEISLQLAPGDLRPEPPYHSVIEPGFGLHLVDYNIPLDDLIDAVSQQAAAMH